MLIDDHLAVTDGMIVGAVDAEAGMKKVTLVTMKTLKWITTNQPQ